MAKTTKALPIIPEGDVVLKIIAVDYKKVLGRMTVTLEDNAGNKHNERFIFIKNNGETNQTGVNRFWWLAETALNDLSVSETGVDEKELVGKRVLVTVTHKREPAYNDPSKIYTNTYINNFRPVETVEETNEVDPLDDL